MKQFLSRMSVAVVAFLLMLLPLSAGAVAQESSVATDPLLLVMDASGSMNADAGNGQTRIDAAKEALRRVVAELPDGHPVGLRVYGHRVSSNAPAAEGCVDTELIQPVGPLDRASMTAAIDGFNASGYTPIGLSLQQAAQDLPVEAGSRTVVLVSDGIDTCAPPDPCQVARDLAAEGIALTVQTVGFQVDADARAQLQCIADATGGSYLDVDDAGSLADQLAAITSRAVRDFASDGQQVTGGAGISDAPLLEAGTYADTILTSEQLFYAVDVEEGQQLGVTASIAIGDSDWGGPFSFAEVQVLGPRGNEFFIGGQPHRGHDVNVPQSTRTITLGATSQVVGETSNTTATRETGTYYIRVTLDDGNAAVREFPMELIVTVDQIVEPAPTATPTPTPEPTSTPEPTPTPEQEPVPTGTPSAAPTPTGQAPINVAPVSDGSGGGWSLVAAAGVGVLFGFVLGAAAASAFRRTPPPHSGQSGHGA